MRKSWTRKRSDASSAGPQFAKSAPAGWAVSGVEVDVKVRAELVQMLKVEPLPRPVLDGFIGSGAGLVNIVVRQPGQRLDASAGGRRQVTVAALAGLLVQTLESAAELALPSHAEKGPEPEDIAVSSSQTTPAHCWRRMVAARSSSSRAGGKRPPRNSTHPAERVDMPMAWG